ncbi:histidine kinase [Dyadobacter sp. CY261]|uniref:sensor histidine kinase n=1 Tax=Dyadobacter sp. CY261 TaxID=2907203 RepID=UPI001F3B131C|nr:histidine kinase [Dyadobacter sp. CY261]MCF0071117.1 histidine kinase [Dyadobacter sp. CY261]
MRRYLFGQKWLLGFALALVYIPLRTFINVPPEYYYTIPRNLPLFLLEIVISTVFYTAWIYLMDWFLGKQAAFTGADKSPAFSIRDQLIALIPAVILAFIFHMALIRTWGLMSQWWNPLPRPALGNLRVPDVMHTRWRAGQALTILALIAAYYLCVSNQVQEKMKKLLVASERLEKENLRARFLALKNQVSPHFLFNNLSVLSSLVESRPEQSGEFIQELSSAYRYILEQSELDKISLREEMKFLDTYMYLLRTRFKEKVVLESELTPADQDKYSIIPLTLQLLVENAVKHNTMSVANPLIISIKMCDQMLVVSNPLQLRQQDQPTTRLGLKNIISRYKLLQDKDVIIEKTTSHFTVKVPLLS